MIFLLFLGSICPQEGLWAAEEGGEAAVQEEEVEAAVPGEVGATGDQVAEGLLDVEDSHFESFLLKNLKDKTDRE